MRGLLHVDPVIDAVSHEIAALAVQMADIRKRMDLQGKQLETHRLELVRLQRALAKTRQSAPTPRTRGRQKQLSNSRPALGEGIPQKGPQTPTPGAA